MDVPKIPPRPKRGVERSVSPNGNRYTPSPLNDPTYVHSGPPKDGGRLSIDTPSRPPSVSLPSIGQEGNEYASFDDLSQTLTNESANQGGSPQLWLGICLCTLLRPLFRAPPQRVGSRR
jgi:hypothetical protein